MLINIALYIPFGMSGFALFHRSRRSILPWLAPVVLGAALSGSLEMTQLFVPGRHCSTLDLLCNTGGSAAGVFAGWIFGELSAIQTTRSRAQTGMFGSVDRAALALLFCGAAWLLFPLFPVLGRTALRHKIGLFLHAPFSAGAVLSAAACWFAAGLLLVAARRHAVRTWLALALLLIPAQLLIVYRQPTLSELLGAAIGFVSFTRAGGTTRFLLAASTLLLLLIVRGLAPFHFGLQPAAFNWIPMGGFLAMDWREGMIVLLEKMFFYGVAVWLFRAAGFRLFTAAALVALALGLIEAAQLWIPGRTPEITDPLLAILMAALIKGCQPETPPKPAT